MATAQWRDLLSQIESRLDDGTARSLATAVGRTIRDGVLSPGDRLPPIRVVAHELAMSPTTVSSAWGLLARAGTVRTEGRRGTVVAPVAGPPEGRYRRAVGAEPPQDAGFVLDLSTGVPDEHLLPGLGRALRAADTATAPHSYLDDPVLPDLAEVLADTWPYPAPAFMVVDGALDALDLLVRTTVRFGDRVVVENPTFPPLLDLLEAAGAQVVGVPLDEEGIDVDALAAAAATPVRAVFLQPRGQNPTGVTMSRRRARALARVLGRTDALVVEDDSAGAISDSDDISVGSHLPEQTVHIRGWSKSHGPDLRLAALSGPETLVAELRRIRHLGQGWSSRLLQRVLVHLLTDRTSRAEVVRAARTYADRRSRLVKALAEQGIEVPGSEGLNIWVPVDDEAAASVRLAAAGIAVAPGTPFQVQPEHDAGHVRVTAGLVASGHADLAEQIAAAARAATWDRRAR